MLLWETWIWSEHESYILQGVLFAITLVAGGAEDQLSRVGTRWESGMLIANTALLGTLCSPKVLAGSELVPVLSSVPLQSTPVFLPWKSHGQRSLPRLQSMGSQRVRHDLVTEQAGPLSPLPDQHPESWYWTEHWTKVGNTEARWSRAGPSAGCSTCWGGAGTLVRVPNPLVFCCFMSTTNGHSCSVQGQCQVYSGSVPLNSKF